MITVKYCSNCGKKLAQTSSKYCPECGRALREDAKAAEKEEAKPAAPQRSLKERIARVVLAFVLIALFIFIAFDLPGTYWQRVRAVGAQYYNYSMIFGNDLNELNELSAGYVSLPLENSTLASKAAFASAYAFKAKQALTSWQYFENFLARNEGMLGDYNVNASMTRMRVESGQAIVKREVQTMHSDLTEFASGNPAVASVLKSLEEVGSSLG